MAILTAVRWYFTIVLHCNFLIISSAEHLFMCLLAICSCSLENYLFRSSAYLPIALWFFLLLLGWMNCLCILEIKPFLFTSFANTFANLWVLILFTVSFAVENLVSLIRFHFFFNFLYSRRSLAKYIAMIYGKESSACVFI